MNTDLTLPDGQLPSFPLPMAVVVHLSGTLDHSLGEQIMETLKSDLASCRSMVVDLKEVTYMDSSGLGVLVSLQMTLKRKGGIMLMANLGGAPREVVQSSQLMKIFEVRDSLESALKELAAAN